MIFHVFILCGGVCSTSVMCMYAVCRHTLMHVHAEARDGYLAHTGPISMVRTFFRSVGFVLLRYGILLAQAVIFPGWKPLCGSPHSFLNCFRVQGGTSFRVLPFGA